MYTVKNLTNSPHKIVTVDGFARLGAREEAEIDVHPNMVQPYSHLGYLVLTKVEGKAKKVKLADPEPEVADVKSDAHPGESEDEELDEKDVLIAELKELGIKADKRSSVEKLQEKLDEALAK